MLKSDQNIHDKSAQVSKTKIVGYTTRRSGEYVEFLDDAEGTILFYVPAEAASTLVQRSTLMTVYLVGCNVGRHQGRKDLQDELRSLFGVSSPHGASQ